MKTLSGVIALMFVLLFGASHVAVSAEKVAAPAAEKAKDCKDIKDAKEKKACEDAAKKDKK